MILVVYAHPYPSRSRANAALLRGLDGVPELDVRSLYDLYPDFDVDVAAEQKALAAARLVVLLHPVYWYTTPGLLKHWLDEVLERGWAYGEGGTALRGKDCLWAVTTGADDSAYASTGKHAHRFEAFVPVVEQVARFCGMNWLEPHVLHGAHIVDDAAIEASARRLRERVDAWRMNAHA